MNPNTIGEMKMKKMLSRLFSRKRLSLLGLLTAAFLIGTVVAATVLSNTLTASWSLSSSEPLILSWDTRYTFTMPVSGGSVIKGTWYEFAIRLQNPSATSYTVIVKFDIWAGSNSLTGSDMTIQYWDGSAWQPLTLTPVTVSGHDHLQGTFGGSGFTVVAGYDATTQLKVNFEGSAPIDSYAANIWVEPI